MTIKNYRNYAAVSIYLFLISCNSVKSPDKYNQWSVTGGTKESSKYSSLTQIDTNNVSQLKVAWVYSSEGGDTTKFGGMQGNPIIIDSIMFGVSPRLKLFAVDAATGKEKWHFDPTDSIANKTWHRAGVNANRGVAYWQEGDDKRIIFSAGQIVYAVNAITGKLVPEFGKDGGINLQKGLDRIDSTLTVTPTSPVMIYKNLFMLSGLVSDVTPGHIRAFDVKTGEQRWVFHTIPYPGEPGYETWQDTTAYKYMGSTNNWSGMSLDEERGILFAGTGNPTNDFYGGRRLGDGLYGNSVLAIDASTGKLKWHFQTVHHDVWDMDISSAPILATINKDGKKTDVVVQTTKTAMVFVFERETGKPIFPIEERPFPVNNLVGSEKLSATQPFPAIPQPFARQHLTENDLNTFIDDSSYQKNKKLFNQLRNQGIFTPPSKEGTLIFPGYDGGGEWGGPSFDPETNMLYVNANEMAWILNLVEEKKEPEKASTNLIAGARLYNRNCMTCHGAERMGGGDYPSIIGVEKKYTLVQFNELLSTGKRMMPGFNHLSKEEKNALASFILNIKSEQTKTYKGKPDTTSRSNLSKQPSFTNTGYNKFLTKEGYPAISPPWGTLNAINLSTGEYAWKIPLGEFEALKKKGIPTTGIENYGGGVVTKGGLIFIAATEDGKFRAINKRTGKILLEVDLPASGIATPAVYEAGGKQFIVIACGGSKWGGKSSDKYLAFALPGQPAAK